MLWLLACGQETVSVGKYGNPAQLALLGTDYVMVARNGVDAQVFDNANGANGADQITLYDEDFGSSVNLNAFKILVSVNNDRVTAVRPYGVTGAISIPEDGFVVAANGTSLPYLGGLAAEDVLWIRPTDLCGPRTDGIPVLMYHDLGTTSAEFEAHLQAIDQADFTTITLSELEAFVAGEAPTLPDDPILITFDDAYQSQLDFAPGLLDAYGMVGTIFVITSSPGVVSWVAPWADIEEAVSMYPDAVELGCHSHNAHFQTNGTPRYQLMTEAQRITDLETCRDTLELHTGVEPTAIAWPFGSYDEDLVGLAYDAGFTLAMSTWPGLNVPENSDAPGHVRRFSASVGTAWSTTETAMNRWHVCEE